MRILPILFLMFSCFAYGQDSNNPNKLPPCPEDQHHKCWGTTTWTSGEKYVGEFKDGALNGKGTLTWASGDKYVGEFKDGGLNGQGTYTYANGHKYVGEFKGNKKHGEGIFTSSDGKRMEGIFENDNFIREAKVKEQDEKVKSDVVLVNAKEDCSEKKIIYGFTYPGDGNLYAAESKREKDSKRGNICVCRLIISRGKQFESPEVSSDYSKFRLRYPKTNKFLDNYFEKYGSCLPDTKETNDNVHWKQMFDFLSEDEKDRESDSLREWREHKAKRDIVLAPVRARIKELCQRIPTMSLLALENLSNSLRVNPNSIQLARVIYEDDRISCKGVFYFPGGTKTFFIEFDSAGLIKDFSDTHPSPY